MSDNKITDNRSISKSNHKILKFITIILSILIIICLFFLIIGFINKFEKFDKNKKTIKSQYSLYYPKDSQIISVNYAGDNKLLLRYQMDGENKLILIDLLKEKILTKIVFNKSKEWKIE